MNTTVRNCANVKSKKHPESRCTYAATNGEFCSRHWRRPQRWSGSKTPSPRIDALPSPLTPVPSRTTRRWEAAATVIQRAWKLHGALRIRSLRGPTTYCLEASHNDRDIYTYDSIQTVPAIYRFSYLDTKRHAWTFDIRFLLQTLQFSTELKNPFTQELIPPHVIQRFQSYVTWLKCRKFPIVYLETDTLTPEQAWNQKVLSLFLKYQTLGYAVQTSWFEQMSVLQHIVFYQRLLLVWLTVAGDKDRVIPAWNSFRDPLFRWPLEYATTLDFKNLKWWRKQTLFMMEAFATRAQDKQSQICGALYILMALTQVSRPAAEAYPFLVPTD